MKAIEVNKMYSICTNYLDKLNRKQVIALAKFLEIYNKDNTKHLSHYDRIYCLNELIFIKMKIEDDSVDYADIHNNHIHERLAQIWTFMLGMLMVQDEYNDHNPNYKSKIDIK